jgi:3-hydroxyisobutyrate dehydrogenase
VSIDRNSLVADQLVIAFVGLGNMGAPMCARLAGVGYTVLAYDLDDERVQNAVAAGASAAASAADAAARADLLLTSLPRPDHVAAVMEDGGALAALRSGSVWVDLTTNRLGLVQRLAREAPAGVSVADSPVTGAVDGARNGRLTLFLGGGPDVQDRVRPVLEHLGTVISCGPLGTGNVVKLVTNQLWFIHSAALGEGFAVGLTHGVELATLWEAIKSSVGDSFVAHHDAPSIFAGHYDPSFTLDLCLKDLGLTDELAEAVTSDLPLTDAAHQAFAVARERYGPEAAELHVAKRIEDDADLDFRLPGDWTPPWQQ